MRVDLALSGRIDQQIRNVDSFKSKARAKLNRFVAVGVTLALSIGLTTQCLSKTYHVSPAGKDANPGSSDLPCRTIQHVASVMQAGDTCTIHEGTYRETVRPKISGTQERPLRFVAAEGEKVYVTGADGFQANWLIHEGGILKAKIPVNHVPQVLAGRRMMLEARWPNANTDEWLAYERAAAEPGTDYEGIVASGLPTGELRGAKILLWPGREWDNASRVVAGVNSGRLVFDRDLRPKKQDTLHGFDPFQPRERNPFFLYGSLALLDSPGEWFFDGAEKTLFWKPITGIAPEDIEIRVRTHGFQLSGLSHIFVEGIDLIACGFDMRDSNHCLIRGCTTMYSDYPTELDIYQNPSLTNIVTGRGNQIVGCTFAYTALSGLAIKGVKNTLTDCLIHTCNYLGAHEASVDAANSEGLRIRYCTIRGAGRELIHFKQAKRLEILYCDLSDGNRLSNDTGALKCWGTDGEGSVIAYNWVHDNQGRNTVGIYLDNYSKNFSVHHNVIWNNSGAGIRLNSPSNNNQIYNNTVLNNGKSFAVFTYKGKTPNQLGTRIFNNLYSDELECVAGDFAPELRGNQLVNSDELLMPSSSQVMSDEMLRGMQRHALHEADKDVRPGAYESGANPWRPGRRKYWRIHSPD